jgi:GAF domain-containing protein
MQTAPIPANEAARLCAVEGLGLLDTKYEPRFDRITDRAVALFHVPISTISLVDKDREWYKSKRGLTQGEGPRNISFCGHALLHTEILVIEDTLRDPIFADNPYVTATPGIRFYAGKSLYERQSTQPVGVFCIKDYQPRQMSLGEIDEFLALAREAEEELNRRHA